MRRGQGHSKSQESWKEINFFSLGVRRQRWALLAALQLHCRKAQRRSSQTLWRCTRRPQKSIDINGNTGTFWRSEHPIFPRRVLNPWKRAQWSHRICSLGDLPNSSGEGLRQPDSTGLLWAGLGLIDLHRSSYQVPGNTVTLRNSLLSPLLSVEGRGVRTLCHCAGDP